MTVSSVGHNAFELHEQPVSYQHPSKGGQAWHYQFKSYLPVSMQTATYMVVFFIS